MAYCALIDLGKATKLKFGPKAMHLVIQGAKLVKNSDHQVPENMRKPSWSSSQLKQCATWLVI